MNTQRLNLLALIAILALASQLAKASETGSALKADSLRAEPFSDAKTVGNVVRGDKLEIISKKGAWLQVTVKKSTGWLRLLSVKRSNTAIGSTATATSNSNAKSVLDVASGRSGTGQVVATTGVRGLSAEELKGAKFNESEIKLMESTTQSNNDAVKFAEAGKLQAIKFNYLVNKGAQ